MPPEPVGVVTSADKERLRDELQRAVDDYVRKGGTITRVVAGAVAERERPSKNRRQGAGK